MKKSLLFVAILLSLCYSCDITCYNCISNETNEVGAVLCDDDPMYSSAYRDNWRYVCTANNGRVESYKK